MTSKPHGVGYEDPGGDSSGRHGFPTCPGCGSAEVRPSRSSYPLDKEKIAGGSSSFWRCGNCGNRFLGPVAPERSQRSSRLGKDPLRRQIDSQRGVRRWWFPLFVLIATVLVVILILAIREGDTLGLGIVD